jgi:site-specific DNA recombinase
MKQQYKVGAYCRLSRDDDNIGESGSISSQKEIIRQFCKTDDLEISQYYQDDGFSGTNFNRPDFQRLIADIESGKIDCVITKDLSRLGRDYIMTGYYTEVYFIEKGVRYIAIGDGFDTFNGNSSSNDIAPFKNLLNDLYAKDISKKIRSSLQAKALNGEHGTTYAPMGYKKDTEVKNHLIIDDEIVWLIKLIFEMYVKGKGCRQIRDYLCENKILTPAGWIHKQGSAKYDFLKFDTDENAKYKWSTDTVLRTLKNEVYIGNSVHYRNRKPNYKSKTKRQPKDSYLIIPNTHEPIIDMKTWDKVQKRLALHVDGTKKHKNILLGLAKCADCGKSLTFNCKTRKGTVKTTITYSMSCYTYVKFGKSACSCHYIDYDKLCKIVLHSINDVIKMVNIDEDKMLKKLREIMNDGNNNEADGICRKINALEKRLADISMIFTKLYEDRALSSISEDNYHMLSDKFFKEHEQLSKELEQYQSQAKQYSQSEQDIFSFIDLIKSVKPLTTLDAQTLNTLIDKVAVHNVEQTADGKTQQIDVYFKFVGKLSL